MKAARGREVVVVDVARRRSAAVDFVVREAMLCGGVVG